jgi:hypothetical protein
LRMGFRDSEKNIDLIRRWSNLFAHVPWNKVRKSRDTYVVMWSGGSAVKLGRTLYTNCSHYLERKLRKVHPHLQI